MCLIIRCCIVLKHACSSEPATNEHNSKEETRVKDQPIKRFEFGQVTAEDIIKRMRMNKARVERLLEQLLYVTDCFIINTLVKHCSLSHRFHQFLNFSSSKPFFLLQRYVICILPDFKSHLFESRLSHMPLKLFSWHIQRLK